MVNIGLKKIPMDSNAHYFRLSVSNHDLGQSAQNKDTV